MVKKKIKPAYLKKLNHIDSGYFLTEEQFEKQMNQPH